MFPKAVLASVAALAIAGIAGTAMAHSINSHVLRIQLPDGSVEQILYTGNRPPEVNFALSRADAGFFSVPDMFGPGSPFAQMERISAVMDLEANAVLQQASHLEIPGFAGPGALSVDFSDLPAGAEGYSSVSTMSGGHVCTRTMEYDSTGHGRPRVRTKVSGDCPAASVHGSKAPAMNRERRTSDPHVIEANYRPGTAGGANSRLLAYAFGN